MLMVVDSRRHHPSPDTFTALALGDGGALCEPASALCHTLTTCATPYQCCTIRAFSLPDEIVMDDTKKPRKSIATNPSQDAQILRLKHIVELKEKKPISVSELIRRALDTLEQSLVKHA